MRLWLHNCNMVKWANLNKPISRSLICPRERFHFLQHKRSKIVLHFLRRCCIHSRISMRGYPSFGAELTNIEELSIVVLDTSSFCMHICNSCQQIPPTKSHLFRLLLFIKHSYYSYYYSCRFY